MRIAARTGAALLATAAVGALTLLISLQSEGLKHSSGQSEPSLEYVGDVPLIPGRPGVSIQAIYSPLMVDVSAPDWLFPDDQVVGVVVDGEARAYPVRIIHWHEVVNDRFKDTPVVVTYCPLAGSALTFSAGISESRQLTFSVAEVLFESTLVMQDMETKSLWYQLRGEAIKGSLKGERLKQIDTTLCTWAHWREQHPGTKVLTFPPDADAALRAKYQSAPVLPAPGMITVPDFPVTYLDESRPAKERAWGALVGGRQILFPLSELERSDARVHLSDGDLIVSYDTVAQSATATREQGGAVPLTPCYFFAWKAAYWKSEVWSGNIH